MAKVKSELREDLVSGDWILISPGRSAKPNEFRIKTKKIKRTPISKCVFENPTEAGGGVLISSYSNGKRTKTPNKNWGIQVVPNKYPAVNPLDEKDNILKKESHGPYSKIDGVGHHELVITRDHDKDISFLSQREINNLLFVFKDRYKELTKYKSVKYIAVFHNWGDRAGTSIYHPHYQIITLPIIPPDITRSLKGSDKYFSKHKKCVYCDIIKFEKKEKKRIIAENDYAIAFAPYVSKVPFELRIFPKKHISYFDATTPKIIEGVSSVLGDTLKKMRKAIAPNYNFYIHTSPVKNKDKYKNYHWHIEILPKTGHYAGFELETGVTINSVDPDVAARKIKSQ